MTRLSISLDSIRCHSIRFLSWKPRIICNRDQIEFDSNLFFRNCIESSYLERPKSTNRIGSIRFDFDSTRTLIESGRFDSISIQLELWSNRVQRWTFRTTEKRGTVHGDTHCSLLSGLRQKGARIWILWLLRRLECAGMNSFTLEPKAEKAQQHGLPHEVNLFPVWSHNSLIGCCGMSGFQGIYPRLFRPPLLPTLGMHAIKSRIVNPRVFLLSPPELHSNVFNNLWFQLQIYLEYESQKSRYTSALWAHRT